MSSSSSQINCSDLELVDLLKVFPASYLGSLGSFGSERRNRAPRETGESGSDCRLLCLGVMLSSGAPLWFLQGRPGLNGLKGAKGDSGGGPGHGSPVRKHHSGSCWPQLCCVNGSGL